MRTFPLVLAFVALAGSAGALELSLEENRTQKGSVGYVDMQRVFSESPDSALAKESFEQIVREAEERVNLKRAEILKLHQELDATKAEREKLSKEALTAPSAASAAGSAPVAGTAAAARVAPLAPPTSSTAPAGALPLATLLSLSAPPAVAASTAAAAATPAGAGRGRRYRDDPNDITASTTPVTVALAPVATSTAAVAASTAAAGVAASTAAVAARAVIAASTATAAAPIAVSASTAPAAAPAIVQASTAAVAAPTVALSTASLTGTAAVAAHVLELDGKIITLEATILKKEEALVRERSETDKGLVSIEGRKTDQVLVKIYAAITAVAHQEGISIVVDRSTILYGQQGVDLTDKVLLYLRSPAQP